MAADPAGSGPAAKRPRVEDVLQQTAPREQLLISELMGWRGSSNQDSMSLLGGVSTGVTATTGCVSGLGGPGRVCKLWGGQGACRRDQHIPHRFRL